MVSLSIAVSVAVLNIHFRGHKLYPVPNLIKSLLLMDTGRTENKEPSPFKLKVNVDEVQTNHAICSNNELYIKSMSCSSNLKKPSTCESENFSPLYETRKKAFSKTSLVLDPIKRDMFQKHDLKMNEILKLFAK